MFYVEKIQIKKDFQTCFCFSNYDKMYNIVSEISLIVNWYGLHHIFTFTFYCSKGVSKHKLNLLLDSKHCFYTFIVCI